MSLIQRAYKTELDLNNEKITACKKHAGAARWAHNWGLACKQDDYRRTAASPSAMDLHGELNAPHKRRCATWTSPSPTPAAAPSCGDEVHYVERLVIHSGSPVRVG
jgi:hypothetical protein